MVACGSAPCVDSGLLHIHEGRTDRFTQAEGLSGKSVNSLFEDREGNIWVATAEGLDRFRDFAIPTFSDQQGFSSRGIFSVLAARDGSLWLGASDGLNRWNKGQITVYRNRGSGVRGGSPVSGLTAGRGRTRGARFGRLPTVGCRRTAHSLFQDARGQMWVGTQSGVAFLKSDRFVPVASVPVRNRLFLHRGQCRERLGESSGGAFPFVPSACGRTHPLGQARAQTTGYCSTA